MKTFRVNHNDFLANIYLFKVTNRNTGNMCEISSKLTVKIPEQSFSVRLTLNIFQTFF